MMRIKYFRISTIKVQSSLDNTVSDDPDSPKKSVTVLKICYLQNHFYYRRACLSLAIFPSRESSVKGREGFIQLQLL